MEVVQTPIAGVLLIKPKVWGDQRGYFVETWQQQRYEAAGIDMPFVQDNHSMSVANGLADGISSNFPSAYGTIDRLGLNSFFMPQAFPLFSRNLHPAVLRNRDDLARLMDEGLSRISRAEMVALEERWVRNPAHRVWGDMVTAYGREEIMEEAQAEGISHFLIKPVSPSLLQHAILDVFGQRVVDEDSSGLPQELRIPAKYRGRRVLLAEDNEVNQLVAKELLESAGFVVDIASSGLEALQKAEGTDYTMASANVAAICRCLTSCEKKTSAIPAG